jgi:hypothetical protein
MLHMEIDPTLMYGANQNQNEKILVGNTNHMSPYLKSYRPISICIIIIKSCDTLSYI